ncbi:MAG TPA: glutaredoxin family protein [Dehalococcoidia bacterium]|nr:glutaredoxin family protein [Dehalococcoidia bacterium]
MPDVVLYSRPGCHLCEDALQLLESLRAEFGFALSEVNIESDPELERRFFVEIPVIELDGDVIVQAPIDAAVLRRALANSS